MNPYNEALECYEEAEREFENGHYHLVVGKLQYALHLLEEIKTIIAPKKYKKRYSDILLLLCRSYMKLKSYEKVIEISDKGCSLHKNGDNIRFCQFYSEKAYTLSQQKKNSQSILIYKEILELLEFENCKIALKMKLRILYNVANSYLQFDNLRKAKKYYLKAFTLQKKVNNKKMHGNLLYGFGYIFHLQEKHDFAYRCYQKSLKCYDIDRDSYTYNRLLHNIGEIYLSWDLKEEARQYFKKSIEDKRLIKTDKIRVAGSLRGISSTYIGVDHNKVYAYSLSALKLLMDNVTSKFSKEEEKELCLIFGLLSYSLFFKKKIEESKLFMYQAEKIFNKYDFKEQFKEFTKIRNKISF